MGLTPLEIDFVENMAQAQLRHGNIFAEQSDVLRTDQPEFRTSQSTNSASQRVLLAIIKRHRELIQLNDPVWCSTSHRRFSGWQCTLLFL